jgi:hypothetical protein
MYWDENDDRLLVCEAEKSRISSPTTTNDTTTNNEDTMKQSTEPEEDVEVEIVLFFATTEYGVKLQDSFPRQHPNGSLIGLSVPKVFFRGANTVQPTGTVCIYCSTL